MRKKVRFLLAGLLVADVLLIGYLMYDYIQNKMKTVLNYVQENFNRDMSIEEIAKLCNFSEYHFMRFFKKYAGTSCLKYINNYRLEKSAELLKSTSSSITDISLECGFNNLSYFNKLFKSK